MNLYYVLLAGLYLKHMTDTHQEETMQANEEEPAYVEHAATEAAQAVN
jgi:hypothetical protein